MDANGEEEKSKPKHEEPGAKEDEGNETGIINLKFIFHLMYKFFFHIFSAISLISLEDLLPYAALSVRAVTPKHLLWLSMFDGPLIY